MKQLGKPVFVVAEAGCNHMCEIDLAKRMIDEAKGAGADAIKFQTYKAEELVTDQAAPFWTKENINQLDYYKRLDRFGIEEYRELFSYSEQVGITCFSSPFDFGSVDLLNQLDMPIYKIASCDINNHPLIQHISQVGKPIILSTGAATQEEIDKALEVIKDTNSSVDVALLACTLSYPTSQASANLWRIQTLKSLYPDHVIGFSDHTEPEDNMVIPAVAVGIGARIIEKHFTLDRTMTGSGHHFAVNPKDLAKMVENIRIAEKIVGDGDLGVANVEESAWEKARRSIVVTKKRQKGEVLTIDSIGYKRPGTGLPPSDTDQVVGKKLSRNVDVDEFVDLSMLVD